VVSIVLSLYSTLFTLDRVKATLATTPSPASLLFERLADLIRRCVQMQGYRAFGNTVVGDMMETDGVYTYTKGGKSTQSH
jgi:hypothetical protein